MRSTDAAAPAADCLPERFYEARSHDHTTVIQGGLIYVSIEKRESFDKITATCSEPQVGRYGTCLAKQIGDPSTTVVFRFWLKRLTSEGLRLDWLLEKRQTLIGRGDRADLIETEIRGLGAGKLLDNTAPAVVS